MSKPIVLTKFYPRMTKSRVAYERACRAFRLTLQFIGMRDKQFTRRHWALYEEFLMRFDVTNSQVFRAVWYQEKHNHWAGIMKAHQDLKRAGEEDLIPIPQILGEEFYAFNP